MAILSQEAPQPTAMDLDDANNPSAQSSGDPEKARKDIQREDAVIKPRSHSIGPELERRVVRKLDWHLPPLVAFLCEFS